jgi:hypothetical protein
MRYVWVFKRSIKKAVRIGVLVLPAFLVALWVWSAVEWDKWGWYRYTVDGMDYFNTHFEVNSHRGWLCLSGLSSRNLGPPELPFGRRFVMMRLPPEWSLMEDKFWVGSRRLGIGINARGSKGPRGDSATWQLWVSYPLLVVLTLGLNLLCMAEAVRRRKAQERRAFPVGAADAPEQALL